jgi:hypothetical protein
MSTLDRDLTITLVPSTEDQPLHSADYQAVIGDVFRNLNHLGLQPTSKAMLMEAADGGGFSYGIFTMVLKDAIPVITTGLAGWFAGRNGRKVRLKTSDIEIEASTTEQVKELLELAQKTKAENEPKHIHER